MLPDQIPYILSFLTFLPIVGVIVLLFMPSPKDLPEHHGPEEHAHGEAHGAIGGGSEPQTIEDPARLLVNAVAIFFAAVEFLLSIALFATFRSHFLNLHVSGIAQNMQFLEDARWITVGGLNIHYRMGVDGISLLLIVLTTFLMLLSVMYSTTVKQRLKEFMVFLLLLETGMLGVFCALDLVLFYVFWEAMLIPMYFLIGIFGHERRIYAAVKFFLYTFAGSIFMLIAIVAVYQVTGSFNLLDLTDPNSIAGAKLHGLNPQMLTWLFAAFSLAFMIKVPMFPFHTWLPDAHVEAPTAGSVILAGVLLKMGTYGFLRFCLPLFPVQAQQYSWLFISLAIIGIIYGSLVAAVQPDAKKLVAYSSVAHLGFVILGIFTFTRVGMMGALVQNINHGISTPMLFFLVGMLYERRHTRRITEFGGLKLVVPMLATMLLIATLASIAVPFFNGFVGEFPILLGSWVSTLTGYWPTALAASGMILSAVYMLWWFQRLMLGPITKPENRRLPDLTRLEWLVLTPLAAVIFWFGLGSTFWTQRMETSVTALLPISAEKTDDNLPISQVQFNRRIQNLSNQMRSGTILTPRQQLILHPPVAPPRRPAARPGGPGNAAPGARPAPPGSPSGRPATPPANGAVAPGIARPGSAAPTVNGARPGLRPSGPGAPATNSPTANPNGRNTAPGGAPAHANPAGNAPGTPSGRPAPAVPAAPGLHAPPMRGIGPARRPPANSSARAGRIPARTVRPGREVDPS